ncbi:hypothetical protein [Rhabdochlamydiaceae symbiont of Dictyostelium giganteum]|uniref:hypothetical protein n=1 Tax=Rhabdochlamydiaceae symbiont of Dictyostelium giganteum TaxID=3342349 RepID=UPI00384A743B
MNAFWIRMIGITFCLTSSAFAGSIRLINDSSYPLTAQIYAADGTSIGSQPVLQKQGIQWISQSLPGHNFTDSQTPYTVMWICAEGKEFSVCRQVSTGSTITAMGGSGDYRCTAALQDETPPPDQKNASKAIGPPVGILD